MKPSIMLKLRLFTVVTDTLQRQLVISAQSSKDALIKPACNAKVPLPIGRFRSRTLFLTMHFFYCRTPYTLWFMQKSFVSDPSTDPSWNFILRQTFEEANVRNTLSLVSGRAPENAGLQACQDRITKQLEYLYFLQNTRQCCHWRANPVLVL